LGEIETHDHNIAWQKSWQELCRTPGVPPSAALRSRVHGPGRHPGRGARVGLAAPAARAPAGPGTSARKPGTSARGTPGLREPGRPELRHITERTHVSRVLS